MFFILLVECEYSVLSQRHRVVLVGRDCVVPFKDQAVHSPVQPGFVVFPTVTLHFFVSLQGRVVGGL